MYALVQNIKPNKKKRVLGEEMDKLEKEIKAEIKELSSRIKQLEKNLILLKKGKAVPLGSSFQGENGEKKYKALFDSIRSGIAVLEARNGGREFVFVDINQAAQDMDSIEKKDVLGKTVLEVFPGADKFGIIESFRRVWESGQPELHPVALYKDTQTQNNVWRESYIYKLTNGHIVSIYDDLSVAKKTSEKLEASKRLYDLIAEHSTDVVWALTLDFKIKYISPTAFQVIGYSSEELIGKSITEIIEPDFLNKAQQIFEEDCVRLETKDYEPRRIELKLIRKDKESIWAEITSKLVLDEKNAPVEILGTMHDISFRKNNQKELEAREQEYRDIFETSMDAFLILDRSGIIKGANSAACHLYGYTKEELMSIPGKVIVYPDKYDIFEELMNRTLAGEVYTVEAVVLRKDRTEIKVEIRGKLFNYRGEGHCLTVIRDISHDINVERVQRLANLGELLASVAHEVNNPLQVVLGRAELLLISDPTKDELKASLLKIREQCSYASNIINQLQIVSNPSVGDFQVVDIHNSIEDVIKLLEHQLALLNVDIKRIYHKAPLQVTLDEKKMHQAIFNLVMNAVTAVGKEGTITITTKLKKGKAILEVIDNGKGIQSEHLEKVMDPFFTTRKDGIGLGLSICHSIIKAHKGELKVSNNKKGEGVTASISLPVADG